MDIRNIKSLDIAKHKFVLSNELTEPLDYRQWIYFIKQYHQYFTWRENTESGKETLKNITTFPEEFRERILKGFNKVTCYIGYNEKSKSYAVSINFLEEYNRISINFEKKPTNNDLKILVAMALALDSLLLSDGCEVITEDIVRDIESNKENNKG